MTPFLSFAARFAIVATAMVLASLVVGALGRMDAAEKREEARRKHASHAPGPPPIDEAA